MASDPISPGEIYWVFIEGTREDKHRISVVTRVENDRVEVVYGQATPSSTADIEVRPGTPEGDEFKVKKVTYFRFENCCIVRRRFVKGRIGRCPVTLFFHFRILARNARLSSPK
jgi:hypothetical protein